MCLFPQGSVSFISHSLFLSLEVSSAQILIYGADPSLVLDIQMIVGQLVF